MNQEEEDNLFFFNFYIKNPQMLKISELKEPPQKYMNPYSETIEKLFGKLTPKSFNQVKKSPTGTKIIIGGADKSKPEKTEEGFAFNLKNVGILINFTNEGGCEFFIKRTWHMIDMSEFEREKLNNKLLKNQAVKKFLNAGCKEYFLSRIISAHPSAVLSYEFSVTLLINQNLIVFELITQNRGQVLSDLYLQNNNYFFLQDSFNNLCQVVDVMAFLERRKLFYCDLKLDNLLIKDKIISLLDFDVSPLTGFNKTITIEEEAFEGYSDGYASPEIYNFWSEKVEGKINPWKSIIYSCGILGLIFSGVIQSGEELLNLDNYKLDQKKHDLFINRLVDKCRWADSEVGINEKLTKKMNLILKKGCLNYNPKFRISFIELNRLLKKINLMQIEEIDESIEIYLKTPRQTKENLKEEIKRLNCLNNECVSIIKSCEKEYIELYYKTNVQVISSNIFDKLASIDNIKSLLKEMKEINKSILDEYRKNRLKYMNYKWNIPGSWEEVPLEILKIPEIIDRASNNINPPTPSLKKDLDPRTLILNSQFKNKNENKTQKLQPLQINQKGLTSKVNDIFENQVEESKSQEISTFNQERTIKLISDYSTNPVSQASSTINEKKTKIYFKKEFSILSSQDLLKEISSDEIRNVIIKTKLQGYWSFWMKKYSCKDIFIILKLAEYLKANTLIFYGNPNFNEECAIEYKKFLGKTKSIIGIDLYCLNFSKNLKLDFLDLLKNENIKYLIMEREGFDKKKIIEKVKILNLKQDNNLKYWNAISPCINSGIKFDMASTAFFFTKK